MGQTPAATESPPVPRAGWAVFVGLLAVLTVAFFSVHRVKEVKAHGYPLVVADPKALDFGEVWEGASIKCAIPIRNTSEQSLRIVDVRTSCACGTIEPKHFEIAPQGELTLIWSIHAATDLERDVARRRQYSLAAHGEDGQPYLVAHLHGRVRSACDVDPPVVAFDEPLVRGAESKPLPLRIKPGGAAAVVRIESDRDVMTERAKNKSDHEFGLRVRPMESGTWVRSIRVVAEDSSGRTTGARVVPVLAQVVEPVVAIPSSHHFGVVHAGTTVGIRITIASVRGEPYEVESWELLSGVQVSPGVSKLTFDVSMLIQEGDHSSKINCVVRMANGERIKIPIHLRAYGH